LIEKILEQVLKKYAILVIMKLKKDAVYIVNINTVNIQAK